ncbi:hypothetical protein CU048_14485 [Beijerinckiaceae bacterium]|nr:hypothetical protein CU048_14485 [Beijerinckiaceae bacterium]
MTDFHAVQGANATEYPSVRKIGPADLKEALAKGIGDFLAMPTSLIFFGLVYPLYPIIAICLAGNSVELLFPIMSGFAMLGSFAVIGLYEVSRRLELGLPISWTKMFDLRHAPSFPSILALGFLLLVLFICWQAAAEALYVSLFGSAPPPSIRAFLYEVLTTGRGWSLILFGSALGFIFAIVTLSVSVVSFPLLLDRNVGVAVAVLTSIRAVLLNPSTMALWGLIVAVSLTIGFLLLLIGLAFVVPILAHATWHLYRLVVVASPSGGVGVRV